MSESVGVIVFIFPFRFFIHVTFNGSFYPQYIEAHKNFPLLKLLHYILTSSAPSTEFEGNVRTYLLQMEQEKGLLFSNAPGQLNCNSVARANVCCVF